MGLDISSGSIEMTDGSGNVRFSTAEKLFIPLTYLSGSITIDPLNSSQSAGIPIEQHFIDTDTTLDSCHADADTVRGAFKVETSTGAAVGVHDLGWFNAGGTYLHIIGGTSENTANLGNRQPGVIAAYTFFCDGGSLKLNQMIRLVAPYHPGSTSLNMVEFDIYYELFCGTFV